MCRDLHRRAPVLRANGRTQTMSLSQHLKDKNSVQVPRRVSPMNMVGVGKFLLLSPVLYLQRRREVALNFTEVPASIVRDQHESEGDCLGSDP